MVGIFIGLKSLPIKKILPFNLPYALRCEMIDYGSAANWFVVSGRFGADCFPVHFTGFAADFLTALFAIAIICTPNINDVRILDDI